MFSTLGFFLVKNLPNRRDVEPFAFGIVNDQILDRNANFQLASKILNKFQKSLNQVQ